MLIEVDAIQEQLQQKWLVFWWAFGVTLLAGFIAWRRGLFRSFQSGEYPIIHGKDVLRGFGYFLFIEILLIPSLLSLAFFFMGHDLKETMHHSPSIKAWVNLLIILGGFGGVLLAYFELNPIQRKQLWSQSEESCFHHLGIGVSAWFVCYPFVLFFSQGISLALWHFFHHPFVEQVAVQNVRYAMANPILFSLTALAIVVVVPLTEEYLFRGLLQSWLKRLFHHPLPAIMLSSLVFSLFHYSSQHGLTNIELLSSLFLLSCMLGYLYERQRSLWSSVGLHGFFNFMSLIMVVNESNQG